MIISLNISFCTWTSFITIFCTFFSSTQHVHCLYYLWSYSSYMPRYYFMVSSCLLYYYYSIKRQKSLKGTHCKRFRINAFHTSCTLWRKINFKMYTHSDTQFTVTTHPGPNINITKLINISKYIGVLLGSVSCVFASKLLYFRTLWLFSYKYIDGCKQNNMLFVTQ